MSDTPRTDKVESVLMQERKDPLTCFCRMARHAEELERELAAMTAKRDAIEKALFIVADAGDQARIVAEKNASAYGKASDPMHH